MPRIPRIGRRGRQPEAAPEGAASGPPETPTLEAAAVDPAYQTAAPAPAQEAAPVPPPRPDRGRMRRRLRYLRHARELAYRDVGGLMFELWRFSRARDDLVLAKLQRLSEIETELVSLEFALEESANVLTVHEPGVAACPNCGELHGTAANFCPNCGIGFGAAAVVSAPTPVAAPPPVEQPSAAPGPVPPISPPEQATGQLASEQHTAHAAPAASPDHPAPTQHPASPPGAPGDPTQS